MLLYQPFSLSQFLSRQLPLLRLETERSQESASLQSESFSDFENASKDDEACERVCVCVCVRLWVKCFLVSLPQSTLENASG